MTVRPPRAGITHTALALAGAALVLAASASAASYRGRGVDGRRFHASVMNQDFGAYENVEVRFHDDKAFVTFASGGRLVLVLDDEEISDPHSIPGYDAFRGVTWEIDVKDMTIR